MATQKSPKLTVITNEQIAHKKTHEYNTEYHSNPMYEKLLKFMELQNAQKKRFSPDDLFKLC